MQRLVIPVEDKTAMLWQNAVPEKRARIIHLFNWLLEQHDWENLTPKSFAQLLDRASDQAVTNGLTPEILAEILDEN